MNPKRLPVRSPKINKKSTGVIANAHNECMRVQWILKSQRQRGIMYPEYKEYVPSGWAVLRRRWREAMWWHPDPAYYDNLFEWMGVSCGPPSNFKRENCATQERSKCATVISDRLGMHVHVRPVGVYECGVLQWKQCMGVVDVYSSINSVALRSATCSRCEWPWLVTWASHGPVLIVRQSP